MFSRKLSTDQVCLNDCFEHRRVTVCIPGALRIDDGYWSTFADTQAVRLRAEDAALLGEAQFLQPPLEVIPGGQAALFVAALRVRLVAAEKDVAVGVRDADFGSDL